MSPLVSVPDLPTASNNNLRFVLPGGLGCLSDGLTQTVSRNSSERSARDQLDRDLEAYIRAADSHFSGLQAEAAAKALAEGKEVEEVEIVAKDPLDFWFAQVAVKFGLCYVSSLISLTFRKILRTTRLIFLSWLRTFTPAPLSQSQARGCSVCQAVYLMPGSPPSSQRTLRTESWSKQTNSSRKFYFT